MFNHCPFSRRRKNKSCWGCYCTEKKGQIVNIEEAVGSISDCVEAAERMAGFNIDQAYVSINGDHIQSQNSQGLVAITESEGEIAEDDIYRVIEAARAISLPTAREIIHVLPREFIVDSQRGIKDPTGMSGVRLETEAHLVTGLSPAIKNVSRCVSDLGINVAGQVFTGLASSHSVLTETEKELGVILADIGAGTTSISVFIEGACSYSAVIPVGARKITDDIAIGLTSSIDTAERIKHYLSKGKGERDGDKPADEIDFEKLGIREDHLKTGSRKAITEGIIRPRLNEIFSLLRDVLKKSGFEGQTPAGVVLTGGGAMTAGALESCRRVMQLPPRIGVPSGLSGIVDEVSTPIYAASVGLILYGYKQKPQNSAGGVKLSGIFKKVPGKDMAGKALEFIKSFLP
ncbi:MAG: Cell division protein ftsA [Candidatus Collierbacteria bacterium GW2011_GWB1_44_35]|uniref:Cell division protein FtsA n=1 Tax=Candidatus Collierbacteria bacterium GW2011_GWB1_44_35 TaxID=1618383 RepID=A0A0G1LF31_9BACT|nr:MAG: Cell division protein ftsA [Candidatus Collierbacteria bacterium GW2011_GWB1_44_35]